MPVSDDNLESLLQRVTTQDRVAFERLYEKSSGLVFSVLLGILNRRDLAEEALQDVYIKVWNQSASYRASRGTALTWLTSIARYRALDIRRRLARETPLPTDIAEQTAEPTTTATDPELAAGFAADAAQLKHCMETLSSDQSNSIRLAFLRGYSHAEVSNAVGAPIGTVKSWIRRGLAALKGCLGR